MGQPNLPAPVLNNCYASLRYTKNMGIAITQVDAFTSQPFAGNPAAVCILSEGPRRALDAGCGARNEPFGNRVSGAARTAGTTCAGSRRRSKWTCAATPRWPARTCFGRKATWPRARRRASTRAADCCWPSATATGSRWISRPRWRKPRSRPRNWPRALGLTPVYVGRNQFDYLVEVESAAALRAARPDHGMLRKLPVRGHHRHGALRYARIRFHLALLRAGLGHRRGPRDRVGAYLPGAVLEQAPGQDGVRGVPGLGARRRGAGAVRGRSRVPGRAGGDGAARRVNGMTPRP